MIRYVIFAIKEASSFNKICKLFDNLGLKKPNKKRMNFIGYKAINYLSMAGYSLSDIESGVFLNDIQGFRLKGVIQG